MTAWKEPAVPRHVVQMIPYDPSGNVLLMHRGPNVRSAPNVWSFPSGLHDIGETMWDAAKRELAEEFALSAIRIDLLGSYENMPGDGYHWVISVFAAMVYDVTQAINVEPDKHDKMKMVKLDDLLPGRFYVEHPFHSSFDLWLRSRRTEVVSKIEDFIA